MAARAAFRKALAATVVVVLIARAAAGSSPKAGIIDYFKVYYATEVTAPTTSAPQFLRDASASHKTAEQMLKPADSRTVIVDAHNGHIQISDSSNTDRVLTMAFYTRADASRLIVVGSSDCADGCDFGVQFFVYGGDVLKPVPRSSVIPPLDAGRFIKLGRPMPRVLAGIQPKINYVPARVGTGLTLKPCYGYEIEEQMDPATRGAIRDVVLQWDRSKGAFKLD